MALWQNLWGDGMPSRGEIQKREAIEAVMALAHQRLPAAKAALLAAFAGRLYAHVPPEDVTGRDAEALYAAAAALWAFAKQRGAGQAKVRAYNPRHAEHGWQSPHTVIEVVNDDMPFLVDSVSAELNRRGLTVHLVIHPIMQVARDGQGRLTAIGDADAPPPGAIAESFMQVHVTEQSAADALGSIEAGLAEVLADVRAAVEDWQAMRGHMRECIAALREAPPKGVPAAEAAEAAAFLDWVEQDNFTFLGYREYRVEGSGKAQSFAVAPGSGLGILRSPDAHVFDNLRDLGRLPADVRNFLLAPAALILMKGNRRARVHRRVHMDSIGVKLFDAKGRVTGERRFIGLYTSAAYNQSPAAIPLLRRKVEAVLARAGFRPASHDRKALVHILETFPRDEIFLSSLDELYDTAIGILNLQERQRIALFVRRDPFERYMSCQVFVPRDAFNTELRLRFQAILEQAFNGRMTVFYTQVSESVLARIHFIIRTTRGEVPAFDVAEIEGRLIEAGRGWDDRLRQALVEELGEERGEAAFRAYGNAFPAAYRDQFGAAVAVGDIGRMEALLAEGRLAMELYRRVEDEESTLRFKVYNADAAVALSDVLPMLENLGLRVLSEMPYEVRRGDRSIWIHDFAMLTADGAPVDVGQAKARFQEAFLAVWTGAMESDGFNRLVLAAGLGWREVTLLRAYAKYLRQIGFTFSQAYIEEALHHHPAIARLLLRLFLMQFDPARPADAGTRAAGIVVEIEHALDAVTNLDEDRILRRYLNLVQASLRTNYFLTAADGGPKPYLSVKLDSARVDELPLPRPLYEIWVYSPRAEAIHLRGGKVARGGIRWSDRREDFRTEILGLMKAQMVKNAVIVPVGSKGGFVVKRPPPPEAGREAMQAEVIECYRILIRGLLDITDNIVAGAVVPPAGVVRRDDDDPYLVVAADKGTVSFSDIANAVSAEYGFWLGDAFASGGSAGYDHKKMAITARGAWESVKRHFREQGIDIQSTDFTVVGVGDMSGDVFGNGMLLSRHIRLVGAFDHRHIFIDPNPDAAASFAERRRLFALPRSSWADYDPALISAGGAVIDRKAKSVRLTAEMKALFDITRDSVTPAEVMNAMLKARVDLLWFGGIGTYVKAAGESHADAGDRANDAIRVNGRDIRARVIGEGANLGCTQRGRIEYALAGGRNNTDAIDNSAGVDCSDHEVNIKILLGAVVAGGEMTGKQRDRLLVQMTEDVGALVLRDNYEQTLALTIAEAGGPAALEGQGRMMRAWEKAGRLDRAIEYLPDDEALAERAAAGHGLTRPELAVLLAYSKMILYVDLLGSGLPDLPLLEGDLSRYFPPVLRERFADWIGRHPLRREIIATVVTNNLVNRVGAGFVQDLGERTGAGPDAVARAYLAVREAFGLAGLWTEIEALDLRLPAARQREAMAATIRLAERAALWLLRNEAQPLDPADVVARCGAGLARLAAALPEMLEVAPAEDMPAPLAARLAVLPALESGLEIVRIAQSTGLPVDGVARAHVAVGRRFGFEWLKRTAEQLPAATAWQKLAIGAVGDDLDGHHAALTRAVLAAAGGAPADAAAAEAAVEAWGTARRAALDRTAHLLAELKAATVPDLAMLAVAAGQLRTLVG
ncbi:MAG: NAD-glutamate dehydrogenase [Thalassobaculales bacterium]